MANDLCDMELLEVAGLLRSGQVSSVELTDAALRRIEKWQPSTNAFIGVDRDGAMRQAAERDAERAASAGDLGPLHGIPVAHKDMFYRSGTVVSCGSEVRRGWVADRNATVLNRLDTAGVVTVGTLNMSEFAAHPLGENEHYGNCHTPWRDGHAAGGSSSGSASAVAAGMIFGSLGSDTGGSIRVPAALNGVSGFMPTYGRVSRHGVMGRSWSLDHVGPFARSAADCRAIFEAIEGPDPLDGSCIPVHGNESGDGLAFADMRIGIPDLPQAPIAPRVLDSWQEAVRAFGAAGARTVTTTLPDLERLFDLCEIIVKSEAASMHGEWFRADPARYSPYMRSRIEGGFFVPATFYIEALALRGRILKECLASTFAGCDAILLPTTTVTAPSLSSKAAAGVSSNLAGMATFTRPFNYLGLPSISVPSGHDEDGLPVGIQIIGKPMQDHLVLRIAEAYQSITDWHRRRPVMA